jgi:mannose-6-phosphate isomerase-like protein (cupin superfamily)
MQHRTADSGTPNDMAQDKKTIGRRMMTDTKSRPRRVVTGLDAEGRGCVIIDGPIPDHGGPARLIWRTAAVPADNSGNEDTTARFSMEMFHDGGSNFMVTEMPVGIGRFMHATDTIDYVIILSGRIVLELEAGETEVGPGDFIVDRGTVHSFRNEGPDPVVMAAVTLPALPLGKGRTV